MGEVVATPDHDLLIRIDTKLDIYMAQVAQLKSDLDKGLTEVWSAIDSLRSDVQTAKGFISGSKFVWAIIGAIPASLIAVYTGLN